MPYKKETVTLQINLAPGDFPHAKYILPHQLEILYNQVDEILLVLDTKASKGRFGEGWIENKEKLEQFLIKEIQPKHNIKIVPVDYSKSTQQKIASFFFGHKNIPEKDFRGGPFYAYFYGIYQASNALILHLDSDMLLGGGSSTWISEAISLFKEKADLLIASPLPGPPHLDETLIHQTITSKVPGKYSFEIEGMSTRIFMLDKDKFIKSKLSLKKPSLKNQLKALIEGNSNADLPEHIISRFMRNQKLKRIDFLGIFPGLWSLHPPFRTEEFYLNLPTLINRIANNDLPSEQQGFYDIVDEVVDWSEAREKLKKNRWWTRLLK
jgi:hypothetical protein